MGYWPSVRSRWLDIGQVLFLRVYGPRRSRGPQTRKKRTRPISSHFDRTNLVNKGFIIWLLVKFCSRDTAGSQSQRAIWFILPAHGASHIIICDIVLKLEVGRFYKAFSHIIKHFPCMGTMATWVKINAILLCNKFVGRGCRIFQLLDATPRKHSHCRSPVFAWSAEIWSSTS